MLKHIIRFLLLLFSGINLHAQCAFFGNVQTAPSTTNIITLDVSGAVNNDLSNPNQGVCGININFSHARVADLEIFLVSPGGDTVQLVGPLGPQLSTQGTRWNISFLTCSTAPSPDVNSMGVPFSPVFNNLQDWGILNNWNGGYHPHQGCLEDFNTGTVNGTWQLIIVNSNPFTDLPGVYSAILRDLVIFFCDTDGLDCFVCLANGGNINTPKSVFCEGDEDLRIQINRSFTGFPADPNEYSYLYMIFKNNTLIDTVTIVDLRAYSPGRYEVCGLSVLNTDKDSIPDQGTMLIPGVLRDSLLRPNAPFCGKMSGTCLQIDIFPIPDTAFVQEVICSGDSIELGGFYYSFPGTYEWEGVTEQGCDSIVVLDLQVLNLNIVSLSYDSLNCTVRNVPLRFGFLSNSFTEDELSFAWLNEQGDLLSDLESFSVSDQGLYRLIVRGERNGVICEQILEYNVFRQIQTFDYDLVAPDSICSGLETNIIWPGSALLNEYNWTITGPADIISGEDTNSVTVSAIAGGDIEICLGLVDPCLSDTTFCTTIHAVEIPQISVLFPSEVCSDDAFIEISGFSSGILENIGFPSGSLPPEITQVNTSDFTISFDLKGEYSFVYMADPADCIFSFPFQIEFEPKPEFRIIMTDSVFCNGNPLEIVVENLSTVDLVFNYDWLNNIQELVIQPGIQVIPVILPVDAGIYTLSISGGTYRDLPLCSWDTLLLFNILMPQTPTWQQSIQVCNAEDTGEVTEINFFDLFAGNISNPEFSNPGSIGTGTFPVIDFNQVEPGQYIFPFTIFYNQTCDSVSSEIFVEVLECRCPIVEFISNDNSFCLSESIDLNSFIQGSVPGSWELVEQPNTGGGFTLINGVFSSLSSEEGLFRFNFIPTGLPDGCPSEFILHLNGEADFRTGRFTSEVINICVAVDSSFSLFELLVDVDPGGVFSFTNGPGDPEILNQSSGILHTGSLMPGSYEIIYSAPANIDCKENPARILLEVDEPEQFDLPDKFFITCDVEEVNLQVPLAILSGSYDFIWQVVTPLGTNTLFDESIVIRTGALVTLYVSSQLNGCISETQVEVEEVENSITGIQIDITSSFCNEPFFDVSVLNVVGGQSPFKFQIGNFPPTSQSLFRNVPSGTYSFSVVDANGCTYEELISHENIVNYQVDIGEDRIIQIGDSIHVSYITDIDESNILEYFWRINNQDTCSGCEILILTPFQNSKIELIIVTSDGCEWSDIMFIYVDETAPFYIPSGFSPNGDGTNDILFIYPANQFVFIESWEIFDRWGNKLFEANSFNPESSLIGWDGTFRGSESIPGVYVIKIAYRNENGTRRNFSGEVAIMK